MEMPELNNLFCDDGAVYAIGQLIYSTQISSCSNDIVSKYSNESSRITTFDP